MAKKAQQSETPASKAAPDTLASAIREALSDRGLDASKSEVEEWITSHHSTMKYKEATLNSSLSNIRKKMREEAAAMGGEPTVNDLFKVKDAADEHGGIDVFLKFVEQAENLAKKFGGLDRVRKCLKTLKDMRE